MATVFATNINTSTISNLRRVQDPTIRGGGSVINQDPDPTADTDTILEPIVLPTAIKVLTTPAPPLCLRDDYGHESHDPPCVTLPVLPFWSLIVV